jgi:rod shape-determining protein MreD
MVAVTLKSPPGMHAMVRRTRLVACAAVLFLLQATVAHRFSYGALRPDLLALLVIYLGLEADFAPALIGAFALGVLRDVGSLTPIGLSALLYLPATGALLAVRERLFREHALMDMVFAFCFVLACGTVHALGAALLLPSAQAGPLAARALGQAVYTAALSPLFFVACTAVGIVDRPWTALPH